MEVKTRAEYFVVAILLIVTILGVIWFLYDRIVIVPEPTIDVVGTYHFSYTYEKEIEAQADTNEEEQKQTLKQPVTVQLALRLERDGTAYMIATDGNNEIESTKGSYQLDGTELVYTRLFIQNDDRFDLLFESSELPKKERFVIEGNQLKLNRHYFTNVFEQQIPIILEKQIG